MDLFLVGDLDTDQIKEMVCKSFSRFPFAEGPRLEVPQVGITRSHKPLNAVSKELERPLSEILIAWNTGVGVTNPQARTLLALGECINKVLFSQLREKFGDTYSPKASFKVDSCSGIFEIKISSTNNPEAVERRIIEALATLKNSIDVRELQRFSNRLELKRRKDAQNNDDLLRCMVDRALHGASTHDFVVKTITSGEVRTAARQFLPSHKGAYVRLALVGQ